MQKVLVLLNNGMKLWLESELTSLFTPSIVIIIFMLSLLIIAIIYAFWKLKKTQKLLQHDQMLFIKQKEELKITKEKAEHIEAQFKAYTEQSPTAIYTANVDGDCIYANETWLEITGMNLDEAIGKGWINALHPDDKERVNNGWYDSVKSNGEWRYEYRFIDKNEKITWVEGSAKEILNGKKELIGYLGTNVNITDRKKVEQEVKIAQLKAEESDRLKSAFLANMSHEIRTPLNGILGFTSLLKEPRLTGEEQQEYIQIIEKGGARLINIINDIVSISKIESGQMEIDIQESNINEQIQYIHTFFKPEAEKKELQFSYKTSLPLKEAIIKTDREKLYAVLTNLIKNAIKYTEEGSIIFGYDLKKDAELAEVEFFVKDTGIGISQSQIIIIFERFVQAEITDKKAQQGAGLGLSISKAYVEMLGGRIWVESEEGVGSIFYFSLPYQIEPTKKLASKNFVSTFEKEKEKNIPSLNILIAEDDEASEILISLIVKGFCIETLKARTGKEAVEICRENSNINLVLMDVQMPDMNGYEAIRRIRQFNKEVIIIAQTAFGLTGDREKSIEAGCNDYITKPIIKDKLLDLIQKHFKNQ